MPTRLKTKKKPTKKLTKKPTKKAAKVVKRKKTTPKKMVAKAKKAARKTAIKAKASSRKTVAAKKVTTKKVAAKKRKPAPKRKVVARRRSSQPEELSLKIPEVRTGGQSGDLQGLSRVEGAQAESVAELIEEGNPFEADALSGVEAADDSEAEVRSHEVSEDDVPEEYLDEQ
jgi:hypothetical protein